MTTHTWQYYAQRQWQKLSTLQRAGVWFMVGLLAYLFGPRTIPQLSSEGTIDMTLTGALFWWLCTILVFVCSLMVLSLVVRAVKERYPTRR